MRPDGSARRWALVLEEDDLAERADPPERVADGLARGRRVDRVALALRLLGRKPRAARGRSRRAGSAGRATGVALEGQPLARQSTAWVRAASAASAATSSAASVAGRGGLAKDTGDLTAMSLAAPARAA